jgi:DNA (cytosine-5)-methyltransferase 1
MTAYSDLLDATWKAHLLPRAADAPTVVSTFAGCGGSSLGYSAAGYRELLAVEWEANAVETFRRNFPDVPVFHGDIAALDPASLNLAPGKLDVLDGSPPCQGFSTVGKRKFSDSRNQLFLQYVRLIEAWQPKVFVMENVSGMVKGKMRLLFADILAALKEAKPGYRVTARLVDASRLGVPQKRMRMIFVGVRSDLNMEPVHPQAVAGITTVRAAIADLADPGAFEVPIGKAAALAPYVMPGRRGQDVLKAAGKKDTHWGVIRIAWDKPARTVVKSFRAGQAGFLHPAENRFLGTRELSRLQSFPDQFQWGESTYMDIHARIGNSVPPLLMRAVSQTIHERLLANVGDNRDRSSA